MTDFRDRYGPWALVAGASTGIGEAFSHQLAERGLSLVLLARRGEPLRAVAEALAERHGVETRVVEQDLADPSLGARVAAETADLEVGLLVYNAALSPIGPFLSLDVESQLRAIDVNCRGPVVLAALLGARMAERGRGGILLMSSMAGNQGSSTIATYAATKAFDTAFGEGLWSELGKEGVDVLTFVAGATRTPSFLSQTPEAKQAGAFPMEPEAVARQAIAQLRRGPTRIAGRLNAAVGFAMQRLVSRRAAVRFMSRMTERMYGS